MTQQPMLRGNGYALSRDLNAKLLAISGLTALGRETRKHPPAQIRKLVASIERFGVVLPIIVDGAGRVIAGWGLVLAAKNLGLQEIPAITLHDLDEAQLRALRLTLNRLAEDSHWDIDAISLEFSDILQIDGEFDLQISGFEMGEIDAALQIDADEEDDFVGDDSAAPKASLGDLWCLGGHRILCGDACKAESYERLLGTERADMVFTDPPYNLSVSEISGLGVNKHDEFAMASGEMSSHEFESFLQTTLEHAAGYSRDGSLHFVCIDWRHIKELMSAGACVYSETKNLVVWAKLNAGMGSLYRSQHELIFVFKKGLQPHVNNIQLGRFGRHRSNVWTYPGQNDLGSAKSKLSLHPTAKPVPLVADALRDCSNRGDLVLDPFGGIGTTLIAAERTGRCGRLIEIEPRFVDITIKRWEKLTGGIATKADNGVAGQHATTAEVRHGHR